jgi:acetoin utilization deacetylase AcuC-like enzyme
LLLVSAGFDAHRDDNMAMLKLTEADYSWVTAELKRVTERYAHGRIVSVLEGGYELQALSQSALSHIKVLSGL